MNLPCENCRFLHFWGLTRPSCFFIQKSGNWCRSKRLYRTGGSVRYRILNGCLCRRSGPVFMAIFSETGAWSGKVGRKKIFFWKLKNRDHKDAKNTTFYLQIALVGFLWWKRVASRNPVLDRFLAQNGPKWSKNGGFTKQGSNEGFTCKMAIANRPPPWFSPSRRKICLKF